MQYTTFNQTQFKQHEEPMFLGKSVNVSRYDVQKFPIFEKLTEKQLSFFWTPEEIDLSKDRLDFSKLADHEKHIFLSNLKYQILLDSIQGRSPNIALLPLVSIPELESFIEVWCAFEVIHSRSYTHIIRNLVTEPSEIFDTIIETKEILDRATEIGKYYDDLIEYSQWYNLLGEGEHKIDNKTIRVSLNELTKKIILCLVTINALEGVRFYVSFACSFAFAENKVMEGNAKIIKLISR